MNPDLLSEWDVARIQNAVYVDNDPGFLPEGDERVKRFPTRRFHGLVFRLDGEIRYEIGGRFVLDHAPGELAYLPKGFPYLGRTRSGGRCYCVNFYLNGESGCEPFCVRPRNPEKMQEAFAEMVHLWTYDRIGARQRLVARVYDLIATIQEDSQARYLSAQQAGLIREHVAALEGGPRPEISISELAAECGMCETYFRRLFRELYGVSPLQYLQDARVRRAKALLTSTGLSVADVAESCGFDNIYHFSRAFRAREGVSPTEYRRRHADK